ncbi:MAG TPA: ROK family protein [Bacteroidales bacterium]
MKKYAIGADIGGSHISSVLIDVENECMLAESFSSQKVNNKDTAENILKIWALTIKKAIGENNISELQGIGFAMPGPFDYANGIAKFTKAVAKYENLYDVNIGGRLRGMLGLDIPFRFMNDATSFAVGESWIGNAKDYDKTIAITLGTGFGSAFIDSGIPVLEGSSVPKMGCVWHLPYKDGIADDYFSTRWFVQECIKKTGKALHGVKEISEEAQKNPVVKLIFEEFGTNLGTFLAPWAKRFGAECLIIGGNVAGAYDLFGANLEIALKKEAGHIKIQLSELMEAAAMVGCARLLEENFWNKVKPLLPKM